MLVEVAITLLETTCGPVLLLTASLSVSCLVSIFAFRTEIIVSWTVSRVPLAVYVSSPKVSVSFWSLVSLSIKVNTFEPVSNLGLFGWFASGI